VFGQVLPYTWLCSADMTLSHKIIIVSEDSKGRNYNKKSVFSPDFQLKVFNSSISRPVFA
jgi:hypothetical protein